MSNFNILHFDQLDSTNAYAMTNLDLLQDRQIILADRQTAGYGRFKRIWISDSPDNLYMTIVLKPALDLDADNPIANLTQYMSLVLCDVLRQYNVEASIKWPNDVLADDRKIAGILCESSIQDNRLKGVALGIGINLNMSMNQIQKIDQPATALNQIKKSRIKKDNFLEHFIMVFFRDYESLLKTGFSFIRERYVQRISFLGKQITVNTPERTMTGFADGFTETGCLILQTENDGKQLITAGDVILK